MGSGTRRWGESRVGGIDDAVDLRAAYPVGSAGSRPRAACMLDWVLTARGCAGFVGGGSLLALVSVGDTLVFAPSLYGAFRDGGLQWAAAASAEIVLALLIFGVISLLARIERRKTRWGRASQLAFAPLMGGASGIVAWYLVRPTHFDRVLPGQWGAVISGFGGAVASSAGWWLLRRRVVSSAPRTAFFLFAGATILQGYGLHRFIPLYGNIHVPVVLLSSMLAGFAGILVTSGGRISSRRLVAYIAAEAAAAFIMLNALAPTLAARNLVLRHGGTAKLICRLILWPLSDRDGDGVPDRFWGTDPNDFDLSVTSLTLEPAQPVVDAALVAPAPRPYRSIAMVLFDTLREDTFEATLDLGGTGEAFSRFAFYSQYRTCSTKTFPVLDQVLGKSGCRPASAPEGLLTTLRRAGYDDVHFGPVVFSRPAFSSTTRQESDDSAIEQAVRWVQGRRTDDPPAFVFIHLRGGHGPYRGEGTTLQEQYQSQVRRKLEGVADFVRLVPSEWVTVLIGDHGEALGEHGHFLHSSDLAESVLRTPFLLRAPHVTPGKVTSRIGCPDAVGTMLAAAADAIAPPPLGFQFASLELERGTLGILHDFDLRALVVRDEKVIWEPQLGLWEAYDLATDAGENDNLITGDLEPPRRMVEEMSAAVNACQATTRLPADGALLAGSIN